jgi:nucleoid-associated protein YgaU
MLVTGLALQFGRLTLRAWADIRGTGPALPDQAFGLIAGAVCTAATLWLLSALTVSTVAALSSRSRIGLPAGRTARRIAPAAVRNAVAALLGVALVTAPAVAQAASFPTSGVSRATTVSAPLRAEPGPASTGVGIALTRGPAAARPADAATYSGLADTPTPAGRTKLLQVLSPGWTPERPRPTAATSPKGQAHLGVVAPRPRRPATVSDPVRHHVVVRQGDTLWSIAARHLGPGATDAEIAQEWPRWYRINRHLIGADPHRLLPGERLRSPDVITPSTAHEETSR